MSNHSGSYMLGEVLCTLKEMGITNNMEIKEKRELARKMIKIGNRYDCNDGEILEDIADEFGICAYCQKDTVEFKKDFCHTCYQECYGDEEEDDE